MAITFPTDSQFIPLTKDEIPFSAVVGNENPGGVDIVGTETFPAIYFVVLNGYAFFRFRLRSDPKSMGGFVNFAWIILFDTDSNLVDSYEWELALRGNSNDVVLIENLVKNSPAPGWGDQAEGVPIVFPIVAYDIARAVVADSTLGGVQNYFLDISMDVTTLKSTLGITDNTPLRFRYLTSANEQNFNKDRMCVSFDECFTDFVSLGTLLTGKVVNKEDGTNISDAVVEIYKDNVLVTTTLTDANGYFQFTNLTAADYTVKITKCCFIPNCFCNTVTVIGNRNNVYNFALAYNCICQVKCEIGEIEELVIEEKERIYKKITDFFTLSQPDDDLLCRYIAILCILDDSTAELDCCISKVLKELTICEEGDGNG